MFKRKPKTAYAAGQTGKTRGGQPYRILAISSAPEEPVVAEIGYDRGTHTDWAVYSFTADGYFSRDRSPHDIDLDKQGQGRVVTREYVVVVWDKMTGKYLRTTTGLAPDDPGSPQNRWKPEFANEVARTVGGDTHLVSEAS